MRPEKAIIISTHLLEEVEAVCSRAIIIAHGRILADETPTQLAERSRHHNAVRLGIPPGTQPQVRAELTRLPGVAAVEAVSDSEGDALMVFPAGDDPVVAKVADLARAHGWEVTGLRVQRGRLDDVFREITSSPPDSTAAAA
jgi:ABC-2 type transport system ATP-binding protein